MYMIYCTVSDFACSIKKGHNLPRVSTANGDMVQILASHPAAIGHQKGHQCHLDGNITLWWTNILPWKITMFKNGKPSINGPFSIAMLVHQRVLGFHGFPLCSWKNPLSEAGTAGTDHDSQTVLCHAEASGNVEALRTCLDLKADPNTEDVPRSQGG